MFVQPSQNAINEVYRAVSANQDRNQPALVFGFCFSEVLAVVQAYDFTFGFDDSNVIDLIGDDGLQYSLRVVETLC